MLLSECEIFIVVDDHVFGFKYFVLFLVKKQNKITNKYYLL